VRKAGHRGFVDQHRAPAAPRAAAFLSGAEAAALLGVKRATLYAYASRGLVRSEPGARGRARRYLREDLERLAARRDARSGHGPVAAAALRWGQPVLTSALTRIDAAGPHYRGHAAASLARSSSFEATAELLWTGELPAEAPTWSAPDAGLPLAALAELLPSGARPIAALSLAAPALGLADGAAASGPSDRDAELARARALIVRMAALAGGARDPARVQRAAASGSVARAFLHALSPGAGLRAGPLEAPERAIDQALVLVADHELNVSAFAVRVAASAGSSLYACVSAGLAAASGPLHGGSCDRLEALLDEAHATRAASSRVAKERVRARVDRGEAIPGFGHPLYPDGDPRFEPLFDVAARLSPESTSLGTLRALSEAARAIGAGAPCIDVGLVALTTTLGLPPGSATALFAIGRAAGWVAHAIEQREAGFLLRPRARYVGPG
jgi:citrate synthase